MVLSMPSAPHGGVTNSILIIDDDAKLCRLVTEYLRPWGYEVTAAHDGLTGCELLSEASFDAVILDVMLPRLEGLEVLRRIRAQSNIPVLMLTGRGEEADRIVGLELGADDYLPKTFSSRELLARLRAVVRRSRIASQQAKEHGSDKLVVGDLVIDEGSRSVELGGTPISLTAVEFDLLKTLAKSPGRVKTREQLLSEVADRNFEVFDRSIDVHISSLRKKLSDDAKSPRFIVTVRSAGYLMRNPATQESP